MAKNNNWVPEIMYEEDNDGLSSHIPFIPVPQGEEMPKLLYVFESRETGEFEPGPEGEDLPVTEMELHQYADMAALKNKLTEDQYNYIRAALGLEPLAVASAIGSIITQNVRNAVGDEEN